MIANLSLETLYKAGITNLFYGGKIVKDGNYYDLYNEADNLILCDGECIDYISQKDHHGIDYIYGNTKENKGIYLTKNEFSIAAFM